MSLKRQLSLPGAISLGLSSILGTGVFVSLSLATEMAKDSVLYCLILAGLFAVCNALSQAQLSAAHPVSGGTYAYAYRFLSPWWGRLAGLLFLLAKSASAATAALASVNYFNFLFSTSLPLHQTSVAIVILLTLLSAYGVKKSTQVNYLLLATTLLALMVFIVFGFQMPRYTGLAQEPAAFRDLVSAYMFLFVAFTGYGRVATMGEEITDPEKNLPKAILATVGIAFILYVFVIVVSLDSLGSLEFAKTGEALSASLSQVAKNWNQSALSSFLSFAAITSMLSVLLNLILGLSRVYYAMGDRGDLPQFFTIIDPKNSSPYISVLVSGFVILLLSATGGVKSNWQLSALGVVAYYFITNYASFKLPKQKRKFPQIIPILGMLLGSLPYLFLLLGDKFLS